MEESVFEDTSTALIEGVSNDVLIVVVLTILFITAIIVWYTNYSRNTIIHPNHRDNVQAARDSILGSRGDDTPNTPRVRRSHDDRCPICIDHIQYAVETNCGHIFCSK